MNFKKVTPVGEFSLGKLMERKEITEGGLSLPSTINLMAYDILEVVERGDGVFYNQGWVPLPFAVGDKVLIFKDRYDKIKTKDGDMVLFRSNDISAIVELTK
jgi:co-chaperonin GroES (HSP10)